MGKSILLKNVTIIDPNSPFNKKKKDVLIENGIISKIADKVSDSKSDLTINENGLHICPGLFDLLVNFGEPGYEYKETLDSGCNAAMHGGFTGVGLSTNTNPARDNKTAIEFCINSTEQHLVDVHPFGTITKSREGKELSEMFDLKESGAVGYFDGKRPIKSAGLMARALLYAKNFNGLILSFAYDSSLSPKGQMNESVEKRQK